MLPSDPVLTGEGSRLALRFQKHVMCVFGTYFQKSVCRLRTYFHNRVVVGQLYVKFLCDCIDCVIKWVPSTQASSGNTHDALSHYFLF